MNKDCLFLLKLLRVIIYGLLVICKARFVVVGGGFAVVFMIMPLSFLHSFTHNHEEKKNKTKKQILK